MRTQVINAIAVLCLALAPCRTFGQTTDACPSYTHKNDVILGKAAELPEGFMLFAQGVYTGLFRSTLNVFDPQVIPGTESHIPRSIDISDDGRWAVYTSNTINRVGVADTADTAFLVSLIRPFRISLPLRTMNYTAYNRPLGQPMTILAHAAHIGFNHGGPKGDEIWYYGWDPRGDWQIRALAVTLTGDTPRFGQERLLLSIDTAKTARRLWPYSGPNTAVVVRDRIFGLFGDVAGEGMPVNMNNDFVTIPDHGNGVATEADFFRWLDPPAVSLWGCGQTISPDGTLCLTNTNGVGSACVPNTNQTPTMDHKGFYITPFLRATDPPMKVNSQVDSAGISINWCPPRYRVGSYNECGFSQWSFANSSEYVIGESEGAMAPVWGLWVVQWRSNTWTLVSPESALVQYADPAIYFTKPIGVNRDGGQWRRQATAPRNRRNLLVPASRAIALPAGTSAVRAYSPHGRLLLKYRHPGTGAGGSVAIPAARGSVGVVIQSME